MYILLVLFSALILWGCMCITDKTREKLSLEDCSVRCGEGASIFGCCECLASGPYIENNEGFDERKRACLCSAGFENYCFKPVTNFLLSQ